MSLHPSKNEIGDDEIRIISSKTLYSRCPEDDSIKSFNEGPKQPRMDVRPNTNCEMPLSTTLDMADNMSANDDADMELEPMPDDLLEEINRSIAEEFYSEDNNEAELDNSIMRMLKPCSCYNSKPERINEPKQKSKRGWIIILGIIIAVAAISIALASGLFKGEDTLEEVDEIFVEKLARRPFDSEDIVVATDSITTIEIKDTVIVAPPTPAPPAKHFTTRKDTLINNIRLVVLTPQNSVPELQLIDEFQADTTVVLAVQAADIRRDNKMIVGTYVKKGDLLSKGESKAGFCSIVNGQITLGVADASPMLEQALMTDGYFFRQYPLVVGSQLVENKPKGRSIRKALVEIDGAISVVLSMHKLTYHEFSQALIDLGARNAIALVGGDSSVQYVDEEGTEFTARDVVRYSSDYINYIVWK